MTVKEAAEYLGVSPRTVLRRVKTGAISPLPKPPGLARHYKLLFKKEDVEKLVTPEEK